MDLVLEMMRLRLNKVDSVDTYGRLIRDQLTAAAARLRRNANTSHHLGAEARSNGMSSAALTGIYV